jgi:3-phenylpropionate/trans-cinnamate dioxygenase ferredoxin reductase component
MGRAVPGSISRRVLAEHQRRGVTVDLGTGVESLIGDERIEAAMLSDGRTVSCDVVVAGIGAVPAVDLAIACGLEVNDGIVVNSSLRTSDPNIYAVGDVCRFPDAAGALTRLESWRNADLQGKHAAASILSSEAQYDGLAYFWSDQFELTLQVVGHPGRGVEAISRQISDASVIEFSLDPTGRIQGASAFGKLEEIGREIRVTEMIIQRGIVLTPGALADPQVGLKSLLKQG